MPEMLYGQVPGLDKPVSRIAQGLMMVSLGKLDYSFELLDAAWEAGITTFDSAHVYSGGDADRVLGRWVAKRGLREKVVHLTKGAHPNADRPRVTPYDITADLHDALARSGFDYVDLYVLHRDNPAVEVGPIVETLNEHLSAGRIRAFGASNWTHTRIAEANAYATEHGLAGFALSSPNFSLAEMVESPWADCLTISGPAHADARRWYAQQAMPLFTWSSLARGFFSGRFDRAALEARPADDSDIPVRCFRSPANLDRLDRTWALGKEKGLTVPQIATAWVLNYPLNIFALIGAFTPEEIQANTAVLDLKLTDKEMAWLESGTPR